MLREPGVHAERYRPPPVNALSRSEHERLHSCLSGAVSAWEGAAETGLRLDRLTEVECADDLPTIGRSVEYAARDAGLSLILAPALCGAVICASLGTAPEDDERPLTETDLAILDLWAQRALRRVGRALGTEAVGGVTRRAGATSELLEADGLVVGELAHNCTGGAPVGLVGVEREMARSRSDDEGRTLADAPEILLAGSIRFDAVIAGPSLPINDLLGIEEGDLLLLGPKTGTEAALTVEDRQFAAGRPGAKSGRRALRLTRQKTVTQAEEIDEWGASDGI